jgi:pyruvate formate lyase activating enzyme
MNAKSLADTLDEMTAPGDLYEKLDDGSVRCYACAHRCHIRPGRRGVCQLRFNKDGELRVPWGYVAGAQVDPIEKKPFAHFMPGSDALTFGMLGCNYRCSFCQNWLSSQVLRDPAISRSVHYVERTDPETLVSYAMRNGAEVIASSYNEPLITSEWAKAIFHLAVEKGIQCVYVSNGFGTPEVLDYLKPVMSGLKIDLKAMREDSYRSLGGKLQPVLNTIRRAHDMGIWVEVVTLIVPGFNDSPDELWEMARFIQSVSADIPWHVTAFHPDYKMTDRRSTSSSSLQQAAEIGQEANLHYVYAGNLPGRVGRLEDTFCPNCQNLLIQRRGFSIQDYRISAQGTCPNCGDSIAGVWPEDPDQVRTGGFGFPRRLDW